VNGCIFTSMTFSSLAFVYVAYASTDYYYIIFSSFDSIMNIQSTNVTPSPSCSFACQLFQRLCKNSTTNVLYPYIS
jgi:hypothetical protein